MIGRRDFLKLGGTALFGCSMGNILKAFPFPQKKPNIIFILTDDLGWAELGCYGNKFNETPNIDKLASQGMLFTDAYAAAPVCSPSRASLMTGQYPARIGITDYLQPDTDWHLPNDIVTLAEIFKKAGYITGMTGKWHLSGYASGDVKYGPDKYSFDEVILSEKTGISDGSYFHPYVRVDRNIKPVLGEKEYLTDRLNYETIKFIERNKDNPFFFYKSHYSPHWKLKGKEDHVCYFEKKLKKGSYYEKANPALAAMLKVIDEGVGLIIEQLESLGIADRTIVVFTSDNGGDGPLTSNAPLRAGKSTLYEGGIREPLIVKWPGVVQPGSVCKTPTITPDFYPTFAEIIGAKIASSHHVDGTSVVPLLQGRTINRDALYWHYPLIGERSSGAIRKDNWKLIEFFKSQQLELYNLAKDIGESKNLASQYPERVKELHDHLSKWREEVGAMIPEGQSPAKF